MISIIDYGLGNISAFVNVYKSMNVNVSIATKPEHLNNSTHIIMPGVGSFDDAMNLLKGAGLKSKLDEKIQSLDVKILGVCIGMQILGNSSQEGATKGLGWIDGEVLDLRDSSPDKKIRYPHMGWNNIEAIKSNELFKGIDPSALFYFLHTYYFKPQSNNSSIAVVKYGDHFTCAVNDKNIYGVQFHPEKSHHWGAQLLKNFIKL